MGHMETRQKEKKKNNLDGPGVRLSARWTDARRRLNVGRNVLGPDAEVHLSLYSTSRFSLLPSSGLRETGRPAGKDGGASGAASSNVSPSQPVPSSFR